MTKRQTNGFKIEDGVPMPDRGLSGLASALRQLEVGQSFAIPGGERSRVSAALTYAQHKNPGRKYSQRDIDGGKRVWRTA